MLETDASLQGVGTVLSKQDETGKLHVIAYAIQLLHPSERSMHNYSSARLELLVLKWAVMENPMTIWLFSRTGHFLDFGDKLSPVIQHGFLRSEENVILINCGHQKVYEKILDFKFFSNYWIWLMLCHMCRQILLPCQMLVSMICGRCYYHIYYIRWQML